MSRDEGPDPEEILKAIEKGEREEKTGKLKIFFGMAAGVGKTFAMLREAHIKLTEKVDVVAGIVETHGRKETQELLDRIPLIPQRLIPYKNTHLHEMDLDAILERKPQLVLVDELAHTNAPTSRHPKRWQDVLELLDSGIDVYTTVNVQHIESRKAVVEEIAGQSIREMVPDILIERANAVALIDLTPQELLKRLQDGKVYLGSQAEIAAKNFFQEDRLTALREITLRLTAEKVDHDLHGMLSTVIQGKEGWRAAEKLMVAVSHSPYSQQLIRATRRFAFNLDSPWIAVHVDDGKRLSEAELQLLKENIELARDLGAEVVTTSDPDVAQALQRVAKQKNVTQIILGRAPKWKFTDFFSGGTLLDHLAVESINIDLHVIRREESPTKELLSQAVNDISCYTDYFFAIAIITALTLLGWMIDPLAGHQVVGLTFVIGIMFLGLFLDWKPVMVAALASACIWNFLFLPTVEELNFISPDQVLLVSAYIVAALITGILTARIRAREALLRQNEEQTQTIYEIVRLIASCPSSSSLIPAVEQKLSKVLGGSCEILLREPGSKLEFRSGQLFAGEKERAVARWVIENQKPAGWSTETLSSVPNLYLPIKGFEQVVGVFAYFPIRSKNLSIESMHLLHTVLQQFGSYMERSFTEDKKRNTEYAKQVEGLRNTMLSAISQQFKKPLHLIRGATEELRSQGREEDWLESIQKIEESSESIRRIVSDILAMSQFKADFIAMQRTKCHLEEMVDNSLIYAKRILSRHSISLHLPNRAPPLFLDSTLFELLLCNLLVNAADHAPTGSEISVEIQLENDGMLLSVSDHRPAVDEESILHLLDKPYGTAVGQYQGLGIEWLIAKAIVEKHEGWMKISNDAKTGVTCKVYLPFEEPQPKKKSFNSLATHSL